MNYYFLEITFLISITLKTNSFLMHSMGSGYVDAGSSAILLNSKDTIHRIFPKPKNLKRSNVEIAVIPSYLSSS